MLATANSQVTISCWCCSECLQEGKSWPAKTSSPHESDGIEQSSFVTSSAPVVILKDPPKAKHLGKHSQSHHGREEVPSLHTSPAGFRDANKMVHLTSQVDDESVLYEKGRSVILNPETSPPYLYNNNSSLTSSINSLSSPAGSPVKDSKGDNNPCQVCRKRAIQSESGSPSSPCMSPVLTPGGLFGRQDPLIPDDLQVYPFSDPQAGPPISPPLLSPLSPFVNGVVSIENNDDEVHNLYVDAYLHNNRLEHLIQVMGYHPKYLDSFLRTQHYMLRGDGPLPYEWRHYIAIMAAGRHQCGYVMKLQINEFLLQGGDERWLKGLDHVPQKLRDLYEINKILAHRPWLISKDHIEKLRRGNDSWSLSELMQAVVLMAHFHAMCSFVYGCGITPEVDHEDGHTMEPPSIVKNGIGSHESGGGSGSVGSSTAVGNEPVEHPNQQPIPQSKKKSPNGSQHCTPHSGSEGEGGIEELMQRMRKLTEDAQLGEDMTQEELLRRFERIESLSAELPTVSKHPPPAADILRFVDDTQFRYQDFAKRGAPSEIPTFRAQDYSWEEQGFSLANRLYSEIGTLLDDKFQVTKDLTYYTMGDNIDVDTTSFRRAIWNYIHCMFGIRHDDYDYIEVNQLLERSLKSYIKTVTCFPESVTRRDYDSFMREFKHSEKVHVNLMLLEARLQGELLYALRAINRFIT